jgi:hypothetical protein
MSRIKEITIFQVENSPIGLIDEDDSDLATYAQKLSNFMHLNNISILETSNTAVLIRPSKIASIVVHDSETYESDPKKLVKPKISIPKPKPKPEPKKEEVDIITDAD